MQALTGNVYSDTDDILKVTSLTLAMHNFYFRLRQFHLV